MGGGGDDYEGLCNKVSFDSDRISQTGDLSNYLIDIQKLPSRELKPLHQKFEI